MTFIFNKALFRAFLTQMNIPRKAMLEELNIPGSTWDGWRTYGNIPMGALMKVCNYCHIPVSEFIVAEGNDHEQVHPFTNEWSEVRYYNHLIFRYIIHFDNLTVREACAMAHIATATYYQQYANYIPDSAQTVTMYLRLCRHLNIHPLTFIDDPQSEMETYPELRRITPMEMQVINSLDSPDDKEAYLQPIVDKMKKERSQRGRKRINKDKIILEQQEEIEKLKAQNARLISWLSEYIQQDPYGHIRQKYEQAEDAIPKASEPDD